jgi:PPK2 family polyphosphate:nucleotide phosphotransferase
VLFHAGVPKERAMKIDARKFQVPEGETVHLRKWPTLVKPVYTSKKDYQALLADHVARLGERQKLLYASNNDALLIIFQAMDAAGKDGAIAHVMSSVNPQGCRVYSYKHPSAQELAHDFLWRTTRDMPERGQITIFNRSYYEEVLIVRVHPDLLVSEAGPGPERKHVWHDRFRSIRDTEAHFTRNGTKIVKFFLHLSKDEQRKRFLARIDDPDKNWKFSLADIQERKFWDKYMEAYEECLSATSTKEAPWHIVPADDKKNARLFVSQIILDAIDGLKLAYPRVTRDQKRKLALIRKHLKK